MADMELLREDKRVVEALRFVGVDADSIYDLVNSSRPYSHAIVTLAALLPVVQHPRIREGIARALSVKEAAQVVPELVSAFKAAPVRTHQEESAKWALGNAIGVAATEACFDEIISLMLDSSHGLSRYMLPLALAKARGRRSEAIEALIAALDDDQTACKAAETLAKLRATEAITRLGSLLQHPNKDVQNAATKALRRLTK